MSRVIAQGRSNGNAIGAARYGKDLAETRQQIKELELREKGLLDAERDRADAVTRDEVRILAEERAFWFRRFHTSLAIANGGALAAISSKLLENGVEARSIQAAMAAMVAFASGMLIAGSIPMALYAEKRTLAQRLAYVSAGALILGIVATLLGLAVLAWG